MLIQVPAHNDPSTALVARAGGRGVTGEVRRQEFIDIVSDSLPRFRQIAMRWLRNREDAEDAVQDAMLSATKHIAQFDGRAQMSTWLTAIVINAVRMQLRRRSRREVLSLDQGPDQGLLTISDRLPDPKPTPERIVEQRELRDLVIKLASGLPPSQKLALRLCQQVDFSLRTSAKRLGVPEGTLKARLARGRTQLMERYRKAISMHKTRAAVLDSKASRKPTSAERQSDRGQELAHLSATLLGQQGGSEVWVGA